MKKNQTKKQNNTKPLVKFVLNLLSQTNVSRKPQLKSTKSKSLKTSVKKTNIKSRSKCGCSG